MVGLYRIIHFICDSCAFQSVKGNESVKVVVRCRPMGAKEESAGYERLAAATVTRHLYNVCDYAGWLK